jgi:Sec-independent protein translocase protein TatA
LARSIGKSANEFKKGIRDDSPLDGDEDEDDVTDGDDGDSSSDGDGDNGDK